MIITGGWNNNPTARTFESSFKHIMTHCGALGVSQAGNCVKLDDTEMVQAATSSYIPSDTCSVDIAESDSPEEESEPPYSIEAVAYLDHSYCHSQLSMFTLNVLVYIAGWIARRLAGRLSCTTCEQALVGHESDSLNNTNVFQLLRHKQRGGLFVPSLSCVYAVTAAEKHLGRMTDIHQVNKTLGLLRLQTNVMSFSIQVMKWKPKMV